LNLDAIIYPTWNNKPSRIDDFVEGNIGNNSLEISPATGQPSITVPMGFSEDNLPAGLQFLGRMYDEPTLIKLSYTYEQGTKHRKPPVLKKKGVTDLSNKEDMNQSTNFDIAAKFIDAFYSFNKDSLQSTLIALSIKTTLKKEYYIIKNGQSVGTTKLLSGIILLKKMTRWCSAQSQLKMI
jgi:hypothetical protein